MDLFEFFRWVLRIIFYIVIPACFCMSIQKEISRLGVDILGYPEDIKKKNIISLIASFIGYVLLVILFNMIF